MGICNKTDVFICSLIVSNLVYGFIFYAHDRNLSCITMNAVVRKIVYNYYETLNGFDWELILPSF